MNSSRIDEESYCCLPNGRRTSDHFFSNLALAEGDVVSTTGVLLMMYQGCEIKQLMKNLQRVRLNPDWMNKRRDDLEYYIPQFVNFLVFRDNQKELIDFLIEACSSNFYFAHLTYFQLKSLSMIVNKRVIELQEVIEFLNEFVEIMMNEYSDQYLIHGNEDLAIGTNSQLIESYGTAYYEEVQQQIHPLDIKLNQYQSIYRENNQVNMGFMSTINFWEDMITISERLHLAYPQIISLKADLEKMNSKLPSAVYIPFAGDQLRNYIILNIVAAESRVFSTKERAPFYVCLELFRPDAEMNKQDDQKQSLAITVERQSTVKITNSQIQQQQRISNIHKISIQHPLQVIEEDIIDDVPTSLFYVPEEECERSIQNKTEYQSFQLQQDDSGQEFLSVKSSFQQENQKQSMIKGPESSNFFGESSIDQLERIRSQSPFGHFKSWKLVHFIVKSGDNLKQEQFALQLISTIDQIFMEEKLPIRLSTYEVISLGPSYGLIELVKDTITIDSLKRQLYNRQETLNQFFDANFSKGHRLNFMHSLVGYSLACYIMQLKDRHNGNILLKRDGHLVHIDFGFFLGNAPGKGIELENKVPFKLMTEYIEVLGGVDSDLFRRFRGLFFKGFVALRKHSDRILLLVKMMYSGHKNTMPCFKRGEKTITQLQERFYLDENEDAALNVICQNLINSAIDNWRAKWYDKYQYYVQGIFY